MVAISAISAPSSVRMSRAPATRAPLATKTTAAAPNNGRRDEGYAPPSAARAAIGTAATASARAVSRGRLACGGRLSVVALVLVPVVAGVIIPVPVEVHPVEHGADR